MYLRYAETVRHMKIITKNTLIFLILLQRPMQNACARAHTHTHARTHARTQARTHTHTHTRQTHLWKKDTAAELGGGELAQDEGAGEAPLGAYPGAWCAGVVAEEEGRLQELLLRPL